MTLLDMYENFILSRRLADLSVASITDYQNMLKPFLEVLDASRDFQSITQEDITSYIKALMERALSKASKITYLRHLKVFLQWCSNDLPVLYSVKAIKVPKTPKRSVRIYTDEEVKTIFDSISLSLEWLTVRNKCIVALMYDSGLRQSEVCNLKRADVAFSCRRLTVHGKGNKERIVPMGNLTYQYMQRFLELCPYESKNFFVAYGGEPLTCNAVKLFVSKLADSLPFELSSHKLRHNFATNYCIDQYKKFGQIDIYHLMYLMGHEDIITTKRYLHIAYEIIASEGCISHLDMVMSK